MSVSRIELREASANVLNALSRDQLLKEFGISRVANITGLDVTRIPIYTASRVLSATIATHAGKGLTAAASRAGAISEAIEFEVSEKPAGNFTVAAAVQIPQKERIALEDCFPSRASILNNLTILAWEPATNIQNGSTTLVPSDLLWMTPRLKHIQAFMYLQMGSNGIASGASIEDAMLSGLYELVERDAWTLHQYCLDTIGLLPTRVPLISLPKSIENIVSHIESQNLRVHLFDCSNDYQVPVFCCMILDLSGACAGTFAGYGAHLNAETAAIRAITEAAQGRCGYIAGARDDMLRRQFLLMKRADQHRLDAMFSEMPIGSSLVEHRQVSFPDCKTELIYLLKLLKGRGVSEVYVKEMGNYLDGAIHVVRVFSPQCEPYKFDHWTPTLRCLSYAERKLNQMKTKEDWKPS